MNDSALKRMCGVMVVALATIFFLDWKLAQAQSNSGATYRANRTKLSQIGPASVANSATHANHVGGGTDVTLAAGGTNVRNCIENIDITSVGAYSFHVLNGGTTIYALTSLGAGTSVVRAWGHDAALCGSANTAMHVNLTTTSAGAYQINYEGFTY